MARTMTNNFGLAYAEETTFGTVPSSKWRTLQPNSLSTMGRTITTVSRDPISKERQREKGTVTDLDSAVEFEADLTREDFVNFCEGFTFADKTSGPSDYSVFDGNGANAVNGTPSSFTIAADVAWQENTLLFGSGYANSANNGLHVVGTGSSTVSINVGSTLVTETAPTGANLEVCGVRATDIDIAGATSYTASTGFTLTTGGDIDWTVTGLTAGQFVYIVGATSGYARIKSISATVLTLDKKGSSILDQSTTTTISVYYGPYIRNVDVDDASYSERSYSFEGSYKDLGGAGVDEYEYAKGNYCNSMAINMPLADKATVTFGFIGTDTDDPTTSRKPGPSTALDPSQTTAFNTSSDFARLRITNTDESGLTTDFKDMTLTLNNNVSPEKVLDTLGAKYMNTGNFDVDISTTVLFSDSAVVDAIRANTTVTMEVGLFNADGGMVLDIPEMTIGDGTKDFPVNESITVALNCMAHKDETYGISLGISQFPYLP